MTEPVIILYLQFPAPGSTSLRYFYILGYFRPWIKAGKNGISIVPGARGLV